MSDALRSIEKCLAAGNEERAIELVKGLSASGGAVELAALETLEPSASVKLRYYLRRAIRAIGQRIVGPAVRASAATAPARAAQPPRPAPEPARPLPQASLPCPAAMPMPPLDPEVRALAERLEARVAETPARRLAPARPAECPLERAELVRLALDLEDRIGIRPAVRIATPPSRRRLDDANLLPELDAVDLERMTSLFESFVGDRPAIRIGGIESGGFDFTADFPSGTDLDRLDPALFGLIDRAFAAPDDVLGDERAA